MGIIFDNKLNNQAELMWILCQKPKLTKIKLKITVDMCLTAMDRTINWSAIFENKLKQKLTD